MEKYLGGISMTEELEDVLIVDDDEDICELLTDYVKSTGAFRNIVVAEDGSYAIDKLRNQQFSLILLDLNLPRKSGLEVLDYIRGEKDHSLDSVIMISGEFDEGTIKKAVEVGGRCFLAKPFSQELVVDKIKKHVIDKLVKKRSLIKYITS
ncbi:response regulator [Bacteriovoracales bacterium]|nr:response regulator [Bacteriovoracales bacterium]